MGWQKKPRGKNTHIALVPTLPKKDFLGVIYVKDKVGEQVGLGRERLQLTMQTIQSLGKCNCQLLSKHYSYSSLH